MVHRPSNEFCGERHAAGAVNGEAAPNAHDRDTPLAARGTAWPFHVTPESGSTYDIINLDRTGFRLEDQGDNFHAVEDASPCNGAMSGRAVINLRTRAARQEIGTPAQPKLEHESILYQWLYRFKAQPDARPTNRDGAAALPPIMQTENLNAR
jgi:hypothetical protein